MRLLRYFLSQSILGTFGLLLLMTSCKVESVNDEIDLTHLDEASKKALCERIQEDVTKKRPFQGSVIHKKRCDTLLALNYNSSGALQEQSTPHTKFGNYHIAFPLLEKSTEFDPKESLYYYSWLLLYYYRDYDRALERLNQYDDFTPNQHDLAWGENVNYLKGIAYRQLGDYEGAIKEFSKAIKDEKDFVDVYAYVYRGIAYSKIGKTDLAVEDFDQAIKIEDGCTAAFFWKAEALFYVDKLEALKNYQFAQNLLKKNVYRSDNYMELFDIPVLEQVEDRMADLNQTKLM